MSIRRRTFLQASLAASALAAGGFSCASSTSTSSSGTGPAPAPRKLKILVLGGTGFIGPAIVDAARPRGHTLTLFNRGKTNAGTFPDIEQLRGDRKGQIEALKGRQWDAVIDDTGFVPKWVKMTVDLLEPNVKRYLFTSTLSVYSDEKTLNQDETAPLAVLPPDKLDTEDVPTYYSPLKAACEKVVTDVYGPRATIVRPGYIIGPRDPYDRLTYWVTRCAKGGEIAAPGDGKDPTQFIDVRDLAAFFVTLLERDLGGAFNGTGPAELLTTAGMMQACQTATGGKGTLVWVPEEVFARHGASPADEKKEWLPLWSPHHALGQVSIAKGLANGLALRPTVDTCRDIWAWWQTQPPERQAKMRGGLEAAQEQAILADVKGAKPA